MAIALPIETERLLVRAFEAAADAEDMARVYCDAEVMRYIPGGVRADVRAVERMLAAYARAHEERGFSSWAVVERESGRVVGDAGFDVFRETGDVELGYTLARDVWGRGYATEAAGACLAAGLAQLDVPRIIAVVDEENDASARVALRLGMTRCGTADVHGRVHALFEAFPLG